MEVRVLHAPPAVGRFEKDYLRVHTLVERRPMSTRLALELATSYAERKQILVVYTHATTDDRHAA